MNIRLSTARTINIGPILDSTGAAKTDEVVGSVLASKNGGNPTALDGSATLTHKQTGFYLLLLTANDISALGCLEISLNSGTNTMPIVRMNVATVLAWDALYASSGGQIMADQRSVLGTALTESAGAGKLAEALVKFLNVATPTGTINSLPDAVAGATSGLLIAGSNVATTFASLTCTGALTISDGVVVTVTTVGRHALALTGNGAGAGIIATGGATAPGIYAYSPSNESGIKCQGTGSGNAGLEVLGEYGLLASGSVAGVYGAGSAATASGMILVGNTSGSGLSATGGNDGKGAAITAGGGNNNGLTVTGTGSGHGLAAAGAGGGTGHGLYAVSGSGATGDGIKALATSANGNGLAVTGTGTGDDLFLATGDSPTLVSVIVAAVWDRVLTGATHNIATSAGRRLRTADIITLDDGLATAGGADSITLASSASTQPHIYVGCQIVLETGTGAGQSRYIVGYTAGRIAYVARHWVVAPSTDTTYAVYGDNQIPFIHMGLASAGGVSTITLQSTSPGAASATDNIYVGQLIRILSGTGDDQIRLITAYNGTTKVATVSPAWTASAQPDNTSYYGTLQTGLARVDAISAGVIDNASFAADVGSTAYATNIIALAADKAIVNHNLDHLAGTATGIPSIVAGTYLDQMMDDGTATYDRTTDSLQAIRDSAATDLLDLANGVESGVTLRQALRAIAAMLAGIASGGETGTEVFKGIGQAAGGTTRVTATDDASGNRTAMTLNL